MAKQDARRSRKRRRYPQQPGQSPGTLVVDPDAPKPKVQAFGYGPQEYQELAVEKVEGLAGMRGRWPVLWVNVDGLGDAGELEALARVLISTASHWRTWSTPRNARRSRPTKAFSTSSCGSSNGRRVGRCSGSR